MDQMSIERTEKERIKRFGSTGMGAMGYRWRDVVVLGLARITGAPVARVHGLILRLGWR
jgi:hypothetical protein